MGLKRKTLWLWFYRNLTWILLGLDSFGEQNLTVKNQPTNQPTHGKVDHLVRQTVADVAFDNGADLKAITVLAAKILTWTQLLHNPHKHPAALLPHHIGLLLLVLLQDWGRRKGKKDSEDQISNFSHSFHWYKCSNFKRTILIFFSFYCLA